MWLSSIRLCVALFLCNAGQKIWALLLEKAYLFLEKHWMIKIVRVSLSKIRLYFWGMLSHIATGFLVTTSVRRWIFSFPLVYYLGMGKGRKIGGWKRNVSNIWKPSKCESIPFSIRTRSLERFAGKWECALSAVYNEVLFQLCKPPGFWVTVLLEMFGGLDEKRNWYPNSLWLFKTVFRKI